MSKTFYFNWHFELASSPEALWPFMSNTNHFNKVTGMPRVNFEQIPLETGKIQLMAHAKIAGVDITWEDSLFEWVRPRGWTAERLFSSTAFPARRLLIKTTMHPRADGGTTLQFELWADARKYLGRLLTPIVIGGTRNNYSKAFHQMDRFVQAQAEHPYDIAPAEYDERGHERLQRQFDALRNSRAHTDALVQQLHHFVHNAPLEDLTGIRPYRLARRWNTERTATLGLFLHAASLGIFDLRWDLLCPECRAPKNIAPHLHLLPDDMHCPTCNIDYRADFEKSVEATFDLNSELTTTERQTFCIGGPHTQRHVIMAQVLKPGELRETAVPLQAGAYRIRIPRLKFNNAVVSPVAVMTPLSGQPWLRVEDDCPVNTVTVSIHGDDVRLAPAVCGVGDTVVRIENHVQTEQKVLLEDGQWTDEIASAVEVTALQDFRDLFSAEALRPGLTVGVQNMVILFTDLKDSTALYQRIGDASAFGRVIDHFRILRESVRQHRGGIVKTIGDAVMAVLRRPDDALAAATDMLQRLAAYAEDNAHATPLLLKIGVHDGPCIAVTLNERLDYFGSTVNTTARLETLAAGGDIVVMQRFIDDNRLWPHLEGLGLQAEAFMAELRGFSGEHALLRLWPGQARTDTYTDT